MTLANVSLDACAEFAGQTGFTPFKGTYGKVRCAFADPISTEVQAYSTIEPTPGELLCSALRKQLLKKGWMEVRWPPLPGESMWLISIADAEARTGFHITIPYCQVWPDDSKCSSGERQGTYSLELGSVDCFGLGPAQDGLYNHFQCSATTEFEYAQVVLDVTPNGAWPWEIKWKLVSLQLGAGAAPSACGAFACSP